MWLAAGIGGWLGLLSTSVPFAFVAFVSFGIVAILFLIRVNASTDLVNAKLSDSACHGEVKEIPTLLPP